MMVLGRFQMFTEMNSKSHIVENPNNGLLIWESLTRSFLFTMNVHFLQNDNFETEKVIAASI